MSAFDRLPADYRNLCERLSKFMGAVTGFPPTRRKLSPQNRRVRFEADAILASSRGPFPNTETRQQRRSGRR